MNTIKALFSLVVLAAIAGMLYVWINGGPATTTSPETAEPWGNPLSIEMPGAPTSGSPGTGPTYGQGGGAPTAMTPPGANLPGMSPQGIPSPPPGIMAPTVSSASRSEQATSDVSPAVQSGLPLSGGASQIETPPRFTRPPETGSSATSAIPTSAPPTNEFQTFMNTIERSLSEGHLAEAHRRLTTRYRDPRLSPDESRQVEELLSQLAGTIIYSRKSLLEPAYRVRPGDTLQQIAQQYDVPAQLLAKINGISDPERLEPGTELKVLRGPFNAVVDLARQELTLMLGGCYAGRFPVGVGRDAASLEGTYTVQNKTLDPAYYDQNNRMIEPGSPDNPLGRYLIGLGDRLSIHGTNDPENLGRNSQCNGISLVDRDIEDLHAILSIGSRVVIRR